MNKKTLVVLSGAGISAESGLATFRDSGGLWEGFDVMEVASIQGWQQNPQKVLDFYNHRRIQASKVKPNAAHKFLAELQNEYNVEVITQNVDNLHEKAGSSKVLHLHGELDLACSSANKSLTIELKNKEIKLGDLAEDGSQLRPYIVWFGEEVPMMEKAVGLCQLADLMLIIGTSLLVYPAASLLHYAPNSIPVCVVDPQVDNMNLPSNFTQIKTTATKSIAPLKAWLQSHR